MQLSCCRIKREVEVTEKSLSIPWRKNNMVLKLRLHSQKWERENTSKSLISNYMNYHWLFTACILRINWYILSWHWHLQIFVVFEPVTLSTIISPSHKSCLFWTQFSDLSTFFIIFSKIYGYLSQYKIKFSNYLSKIYDLKQIIQKMRTNKQTENPIAYIFLLFGYLNDGSSQRE